MRLSGTLNMLTKFLFILVEFVVKHEAVSDEEDHDVIIRSYFYKHI